MVLKLKMFCGSTKKSKKKIDPGVKIKNIDLNSKGECISIIQMLKS